MIKASELIINPDGSVYHLKLLPHELASKIITVGDPQRVQKVSALFDKIHFKKENREFHTHTGEYKGELISVISTGIGTDNIDIVFNEIDALFNIDLKERRVKEELVSCSFYRIGTSGCLQADIPVDSFLFSSSAIGIDCLGSYYPENPENKSLSSSFESYLKGKGLYCPAHYYASADQKLLDHFSEGHRKGITITCPGFYGPQGRSLRLKNNMDSFLSHIDGFEFEDKKVTNFEMETSGIYLLSNLLGHQAVSCNVLLANRKTGDFSGDAGIAVNNLIEYCLEKIITS